MILHICLALFGAYFGEVLVSFDSYSGFETLSICILLSDIRFLIHVQELLYLAKHMCSYLCFFSLWEFWVSILTACTIVGLFQSSLSVSFPFGFWDISMGEFIHFCTGKMFNCTSSIFPTPSSFLYFEILVELWLPCVARAHRTLVAMRS